MMVSYAAFYGVAQSAGDGGGGAMVLTLDRAYGAARSGHWPTVRKHFLDGKVCAACGGTDKLEAHHIVPFHVHPEKELDPTNLIALCEGNPWMNCHLLIGHLGNFQSYNPNVVHDAAEWRRKIENRPTPAETRAA